VHDELVEAMGMTEGPVHQSIQRWPLAMPQYLVGHQDRLDAVDAVMRHVPGVFLTGAAYRGVGIASCVADAGRIAEAVAQHTTADVAPDGSQPDVARDVTQGATQTQADNRPLTEVTS
jgi:protoporphyrinogen/coproporphyrinogen III oxidase